MLKSQSRSFNPKNSINDLSIKISLRDRRRLHVWFKYFGAQATACLPASPASSQLPSWPTLPQIDTSARAPHVTFLAAAYESEWRTVSCDKLAIRKMGTGS
jgi:hypothetical protein